MSILIYAESITERLRYTMQLVFSDVLKTTFEITSDQKKFIEWSGAKLNYGSSRLGSECFIYAEFLLFERGVRTFEIPIGVFENIPTLFHHERSESDLPFDPFAAAFYLASRYEEYASFNGDDHGRFKAEKSLAFENGFLQIPVVNHYALFIRDLIQRKFAQVSFPPLKFEFQLTYDIDVAYAYTGRNLFRTAGGCIRDVLTLHAKDILKRCSVLVGKENDPFDTYGYQQHLHEKFHVNPVYFFLVGNRSHYDNNLNWKTPAVQKLIRSVSSNYETGLHSSYASNSHEHLVKTELERLEKVSNKNITRNRQHFLKMKLPETYQALIRNGIFKDHTLGYASQPGFRASVAAPFHWYDLSAEKSTDLMIYPLAAMDATFFYYQKKSAEEALDSIMMLIQNTKAVNGYFQFLSHNDMISEEGPVPAWHQGFEKMIALAAGIST